MADPHHIPKIVAALSEALERPLITPGSNTLARQIMSHFDDPDALLAGFAEKAAETLQDGTRHNRVAIQQSEPPVAISFNAWPGTHMERVNDRYGTYFEEFLGLAQTLVKRVGPMGGLLQIDSFIRVGDTKDIEMDAEYSFLPALFLQHEPGPDANLPSVVMLNSSLCTQEERKLLDRFSA